jgi:hypothetical protein
VIITDIIKDTTPLNFHEEKIRFFADSTYNPQLKYTRSFSNEELTAWGKPIPRFTEHALNSVKHYRQYLAEQPEAREISQEEIAEAIDSFNLIHQIDPPVSLIFSQDLVSKCKVSNRNIFFHVPVKYTKSKFEDLYRHELETHMLRMLNHEKQVWNEVKIPELRIRRTEEGLASLHTFLMRPNKVLMKSYVTYTAVSLAQQFSFREVFNQLCAIGVSSDLSWRLSLRTKRGLTDTSQPGGLTRDICYLEGVVMVWDWMIRLKNDPKDCYLGRLSLDDIPIYKPQAKINQVQYPSFMSDMNFYLDQINQIGEVNNFKGLL